MAFSVTTKARKFVYSGDAAICAELSELCHGADTLLHWCYRLDGERVHPTLGGLTPSPSEIATMAAGADVRRLLLTHFRVHMDEPNRHAQALKSLQQGFPGECAIVEDLDTYMI